MKKFEFFFFFLCPLILTLELEDFSYLQNGADWTGYCQNGTMQSPIDINTDKVIKCDANMMIDIRWSNSNLTSETENLGITFKTYANWSTLYASDFDGDVYGYDALQFHFHAPSEHTINGKNFDMEMHIVHSIKNEFIGESTRVLAAISILFNADDSIGDNPLFVEYDPTLEGPFTVNMSYLMNNQTKKPLQYFLYSGSLTTPPCAEIVNWYVLSIPLTLSSTQLKKFTSAWAQNTTFASGKGNNRLVMPLNGRSIKIGGLSIDSCKEDFVSFFGFFVLFLFLIYVIFQVVP